MARLSPIKAALIDLSGTLHIENSIVSGSIEALTKLRSQGINVKFVTNTTKESLNSLHGKLSQLGFDIGKDDIYTSLTAAARLVKKQKLRPLMFLEDSAKEDFTGVSSVDPNSVLIGLAPTTFRYDRMNEAFRLLLEGAPLIAIHKARYFMKQDGLYLGPGAFVTGLEYSAGCTAEVVGKPEASFFLGALHDLQCTPDEAVMIGDDVRDDVHGAMQAGMKGILVKTGKYRTGDESMITPAPTAVCEDLNNAVEWILKQTNQP